MVSTSVLGGGGAGAGAVSRGGGGGGAGYGDRLFFDDPVHAIVGIRTVRSSRCITLRVGGNRGGWQIDDAAAYHHLSR